MIISNITPPQVWSASSRSLTNIGSGALASTSTVVTTLATNTTVDLRPSAGTLANTSLLVRTGTAPTAAISIFIFDGTTNLPWAVTTIATNVVATATVFNTATVGFRVFNADAAVAGQYVVAQFTWTI